MLRWNFGRNIALDRRRILRPSSEGEVIEILRRYRGKRIRAIGRLHSWSRVIESDDLLIDMSRLDEIRVRSDQTGGEVCVGAGCQIKRLLRELRRHGKTLPSVGFIAEQSIAGAIATGTHGSGRHSLSHYVTSVRLARYDPESGEPIIVTVSDGTELRAVRCSLGCMGLFTSVTMNCREEYRIEESFCEVPELVRVLEFESRFPMQQFYLVPWRWSFFCQRRRETKANSNRLAALYHFYRSVTFDVLMHVLILACVRAVPSRKAVKGLFRWVLPWCVLRECAVVAPSTSQLVMKHHLFRHVELELFVRRSKLHKSIDFVKRTLEQAAAGREESGGDGAETPDTLSQTPDLIGEWHRLRGTYCHHYPICVRRVRQDDALISMSASAVNEEDDPNVEGVGEDWYAITFTSYVPPRKLGDFLRLARFLTASMAHSYGARPHWGKLCPLASKRLAALYPRLTEFARICQENDPDARFANAWLDDVLRQAPWPTRQASETKLN